MTVTPVPGAEPNSTLVAAVTNPVPVTVTEVPPATGPLDGLIPVTVGAAAAVTVSINAQSPSAPLASEAVPETQ